MQTLTREKKKKSPEIYSVNYETVHLNLTGNFEFVCHFLFSVNVFQTSKTFFKSYNISNWLFTGEIRREQLNFMMFLQL